MTSQDVAHGSVLVMTAKGCHSNRLVQRVVERTTGPQGPPSLPFCLYLAV